MTRGEKARQEYLDLYTFDDVYEGKYDCRNGKGMYMDATPCMQKCNAIKTIYYFYPPEIRRRLKFIMLLRLSNNFHGIIECLKTLKMDVCILNNNRYVNMWISAYLYVPAYTSILVVFVPTYCALFFP